MKRIIGLLMMVGLLGVVGDVSGEDRTIKKKIEFNSPHKSEYQYYNHPSIRG